MRSQAYADHLETFPAEDGNDPSDARDDEADIDLSETTGHEPLTEYEFGVKLGDMLGRQDGLVGYFGCAATSSNSSGDWKLITDYTRRRQFPDPSDPMQHQTHAKPLSISPTYPKLLPFQMKDKSAISSVEAEIENYRKAIASSYNSVFTVLVDPFLPIHVRTGILPVVTAQLSGAIVDREIKRLGVWLKGGPILIGARSEDPIAAAEGKVRILPVDRGAGIQSKPAAPGDTTLSASTHPAAHKRTPQAPRVPVQTPPGGDCSWQWVQPMLVPSAIEGADDDNLPAPLDPTVDSGVVYTHFEVMPPIKTGFDATVSADSSQNVGTGMATVLEGYLVSRAK
jgi:hypothetical protein